MSNGYGSFWVPGYRAVTAHRAAYAIANGVDIKELGQQHFIVRTCGEALCCNPAHLKLRDLETEALLAETKALAKQQQDEMKRRYRVTNKTAEAVFRAHARGIPGEQLSRDFNLAPGILRKVLITGQRIAHRRNVQRRVKS